MGDTTVKINSFLLTKVNKFRNSSNFLRARYTSDKQVVAEAVIEFLKKRNVGLSQQKETKKKIIKK